jgi:hypothetical protein
MYCAGILIPHMLTVYERAGQLEPTFFVSLELPLHTERSG